MKVVAGKYYVHVSALGQLPQELQALVDRAKASLPQDFSFNIVKVSPKDEAVSFIWSPRFDIDDEPAIEQSVIVRAGKASPVRRENSDNPPIYHGKHLFVNKDYAGFDVGEAWVRYTCWKAAKSPLVDPSLIGRKKYWEETALPELERLGAFL